MAWAGSGEWNCNNCCCHLEDAASLLVCASSVLVSPSLASVTVIMEHCRLCLKLLTSWQRLKLSAVQRLGALRSERSTSESLALLQEHLAVFGWSGAIVASRWSRLLGKDPTLPAVCNACPWLFNRSRLPEGGGGASFQFFRRYLPQACTCVGPVGCKFPRYPPRSGPGGRQHRLEFGRIGVDLGPGGKGGGRVGGHS